MPYNGKNLWHFQLSRLEDMTWLTRRCYRKPSWKVRSIEVDCVLKVIYVEFNTKKQWPLAKTSSGLVGLWAILVKGSLTVIVFVVGLKVLMEVKLFLFSFISWNVLGDFDSCPRRSSCPGQREPGVHITGLGKTSSLIIAKICVPEVVEYWQAPLSSSHCKLLHTWCKRKNRWWSRLESEMDVYIYRLDTLMTMDGKKKRVYTKCINQCSMSLKQPLQQWPNKLWQLHILSHLYSWFLSILYFDSLYSLLNTNNFLLKVQSCLSLSKTERLSTRLFSRVRANQRELIENSN